MKQITLLGAILVASTSIVAQGNVYSPTILGTGEGSGYSYMFGYYSDMRHQQGINDLGTNALVLKGFSLRLDYRSHTAYTAVGRTWKNVTVMCSDTDMSKMTNTFATNATGTPSMVFSGSVTWTTGPVGYPTTSPTPWGGNGQNFPFGTGGASPIFLYTGKADLLVDTTFTGGVLANGYTTWSTSSTSGSPYYNDNENVPATTGANSGIGRYIPATRLNGQGTCNDSAMTTSTGAYLYAVTTVYGPEYPIRNYRDKILFYAYSYYTAYEAPVLHAIGLTTNEVGIDLNTGCNRLHMNVPLLIYGIQTLPKTYSTSGYSGYTFSLVPATAANAGLKLIMQGAWTDSVTSKFKLTQAYERTIPGPISSAGPPFLVNYYYIPTNATGNGPYNYYYYNAGFCFQK